MKSMLLKARAPGDTTILYLAPYAPDFPDYAMKPYDGDGTYPKYHFNIFKALRDIGYTVRSTSKPYAVLSCKGDADFVFSLMNRMPFLNSEIFVSTVCEYLRLPYLGAPPNVRALAEDKNLSKLAAKAIGIPVPAGIVVRPGSVPDAPPFPGPYFVKDRFGAGSERISDRSVCHTWAAARDYIAERTAEGRDLLLEEFIDGVDVTVPVVGGMEPSILGAVHPRSNRPGAVVTQDLKSDDHLGYELFDLGDLHAPVRDAVHALCAQIGPIDYMRADFRIDKASGHWAFLEINICCHIGKSGAICLAAAEHGVSQAELLEHIVEYSLLRQRRIRDHCEWIL